MRINWFRPDEFLCKCGKGCGAGQMSLDLIRRLEFLRRCFGYAIIVSSGFRCKDHNERVGGSALSRHMYGLAADLVALHSERQPELNAMAGRLFFDVSCEVVSKKNYVHVALPRDFTRERWTGDQVIDGW